MQIFVFISFWIPNMVNDVCGKNRPEKSEKDERQPPTAI